MQLLIPPNKEDDDEMKKLPDEVQLERDAPNIMMLQPSADTSNV
jgi:hypothetical protein